MVSSVDFEKIYKDDLVAGQKYQDFVTHVFYELGLPLVGYNTKQGQFEKGENRAGFEIKLDRKYAETGNLWIEYRQRSNPAYGWSLAGIERGDNSWIYVIGNYKVIFSFCHTILRGIKNRYEPRINSLQTSQGFLLPQEDAERYAARILRYGVDYEVEGDG